MLKVGNSDHVSLVMEVAIMTITVLQNAVLVMEQVRKRINLKLFYNEWLYVFGFARTYYHLTHKSIWQN